MHRILKPLKQLLQVGDPSLERADLILIGYRALSLGLTGRAPGAAADLSDPRYQALTLAHGSRLARALGLGGPRRVAAALIRGHGADHKRPALHLLADMLKLLGPLLLGSFTR